MGKRRRKEKSLEKNQEAERLHRMIERIHQGEEELRNELLMQYRPFIGTVVSKVCKRYIHQSHDEEFSVGLEAFNEAISQYSSDKGGNFLSFADLVIRRRIIDYIRKNKQRAPLVSLDEPMDPESPEYNVWDVQVAVEQYQAEREAEMRREEVMHYREQLRQFDISLEELPDYTPRHIDARNNMIRIARMIAENENLREAFLTKKKIPVKYLLQFISFSRKTVERNRNYIVAITLIFIENYQYLRSYIHTDESEGKGELAREEEGHRVGDTGTAPYCHDIRREVL
ncbi:RNA polymerase sigma-I factor [Aneurinibacillus sp. BA2021]|nr:RNA polymerase sigma-I factor [Aneurinibacillus sp. BA2021]